MVHVGASRRRSSGVDYQRMPWRPIGQNRLEGAARFSTARQEAEETGNRQNFGIQTRLDEFHNDAERASLGHLHENALEGLFCVQIAFVSQSHSIIAPKTVS